MPGYIVRKDGVQEVQRTFDGVLDAPKTGRLKQWVVSRFHAWPRWHWGPLGESVLSVHSSLRLQVTGFYGLSCGPVFVGVFRYNQWPLR